jgi:predicted nucleic acid-binding Zn ribbon protein
MGLEPALWQQTLVKDWPELVGPQLARYTRPGRFEHGVLHVFATHSIILSDLQRHGHRDLLANLQARYGRDRIQRLRLQLDPDVGR